MLRRILAGGALAATLTLAAVGGSAVADPGDAADRTGARVLDVLTYNIHHAEGTDGVLDLERIADVIRESGADVVGLQEVDRHYSARSQWIDQPAELAELLGYHVVFGANIDKPAPAGSTDRVQYGTAILSRYPIVSSENSRLFTSPGEEPRGLLHAALDVNGVTVDVYSTHLNHRLQSDRMQETADIVEIVGDNDPAIVVGDVNAEPGAPELAVLDATFTDAWTVAGHGDGFSHPAEDPHARIDNIYVSDSVRPVLARVLMDEPEATDHLPVLSRIVVMPEQAPDVR
ncbi:endonuclease/exonuclease/phosphatase family metal-dependent hydrolase [Agromyces hippuratus]|uniref:Endonuclease/exonuclease/phosphatase family metal-dependent hydrolase n=1 Tax=Agromyces hippuratus TaxID=286438 RepID=A0A852WPW2_9MICO|nr:endonuclease/exonuclease/phosphatase family protein [Agromyces hippuratus]NYG19986.1 endonuclease/exonuclease/phosphatase family metal-dependent hydrolase [Agromyces hippuratus]